MSQNNNSLRGDNSSVVITGATSNVLRGTTSNVESTANASVVENQLRPYASDDNDPSNKYITTVKYNTTEYWESIPDYIPEDGEFIVYSDCHEEQIGGETVYVPDIKIGDGETTIAELPFISDYSGSEPSRHGIFWATYGETTYGEIMQASSQEKKVCCKYNGNIYDLVFVGDSCVFACTDNIVSPAIVRFLSVEAPGSWSSTDTGALATAASVVVERGSGANSVQQKGTGAVANGDNSIAEGNQTITTNSGEHAEGRFNKSNEGTIHSVGIGSSNDDRANALEIMQNGDAYIIGVGTYDGTNPTHGQDLATIINSKQDQLTFDTTPTYGSTNPVTSGGIYNSMDIEAFSSKEINEIFGDVSSDILYILADHLEGSSQWFEETFGVRDKYDFAQRLVVSGHVGDDYTTNTAHRYENSGESLYYRGVTYAVFSDVNGDDYSDTDDNYTYRILVNPLVDTYASVSSNQLYDEAGEGKYDFINLDPDTDLVYRNAYSESIIWVVETQND